MPFTRRPSVSGAEHPVEVLHRLRGRAFEQVVDDRDDHRPPPALQQLQPMSRARRVHDVLQLRELSRLQDAHERRVRVRPRVDLAISSSVTACVKPTCIVERMPAHGRQQVRDEDERRLVAEVQALPDLRLVPVAADAVRLEVAGELRERQRDVGLLARAGDAALRVADDRLVAVDQ